VAGYDVGGMLYVGSGLTSLSYRQDSREPSLLDPRLTVGRGVPDREGRLLGYWPSYSMLLPECRQAYLEWLAGGRGPGAAIGYVFLFFYGIERRVLVDSAKSERARAETDGLLAEVERLLDLYGSSRSFQGYAGNLVSFARLTRPLRIEDLRPPQRRGNLVEAPLTLRVALGLCAREGRPLPVEWALSSALTAPQIRLRTPAERCPDEFRELFKIRYQEAFGPGGLIVRPGLSKINAHYFPASPTFSGHLSLILDLPEVVGWGSPLRKIQEIADGVVQDLDVYSRWVGRTGDSSSPAAVALLPAVLARGRESEETRRLVRWIEGKLGAESAAVVRGADLLEQWPVQGSVKTPGKVARRDAEMLAVFLGRRGYGVEPDVRFGGPLPGDGPAVLFRLSDPDATDEPTPAYHAAAVLLHLAAALSVADGEVTVREERHLLAHLEASLHLSAAEKTRLKAHLRWLLAAPPGLGGLKKRVAPLAERQRRGIGQFLITVAGADGHVGAEELKLLTRIYGLLGLDPQAVYSDVHALASAPNEIQPPPAAEPVTVRPADLPAVFPIPVSAAVAPAGGIALDPRKVQAKLAETEQVSSLLEDIFREEEAAPQPPTPSPIPSQPPGEGEKSRISASGEDRAAAPLSRGLGGDGRGDGGEGLAGLDAPHAELLRRLAEKTSWPRLDVERMANELGLLPDGALEVINEAAYERCGVPLLEGDEIIEIDRDVLQEITEELTAK
jgi:uncharacterized tellurite resistance protein B-like protein